MKHITEKWMQKKFADLNILPDVAIDVGVNIVQYLYFYSTFVNTVIGFEPNKSCYELIKKSLNEKNISSNKIVIYPDALTNFNGTGIFYINLKDSCYSVGNYDQVKIHNDNELFNELDWETDTVSYKTLDSFKNQLQGRKLDILKIDTEFNDLDVIEGGHDVIQTHRPIIDLEHIPKDFKNVKSEFDFLFDLNYKKIETLVKENVLLVPGEML